MLEDCYIALNVYAKIEIDWDNPPIDDDGLTLQGSIDGFIQTRGGTNPFANGGMAPLSTHILYTDIGVDIAVGEYILYNGDYYKIEYIPPINGISGVYDHWEVALVYQNDIVG